MRAGGDAEQAPLPMSEIPPPRLTREMLQSGWLQTMIRAASDGTHVLTDAELAASRAALLATHPPGEDVWVFGYGSLIWNPAFHFEERRLATIRGRHRRFCLWTHMGRGTRECPGLMLGLERGGSCRGVVLRIAAAAVESELAILWRREMVTASYTPYWTIAETDLGRVRAIGFAINPNHDRYVRNLAEERVVESLAGAVGPMGTCADYLYSTVAHLEQLGIRDEGLERLARRVRQRQSEMARDKQLG
jgi:glutathione-specific gamma-glutamylcyclotransferase